MSSLTKKFVLYTLFSVFACFFSSCKEGRSQYSGNETKKSSSSNLFFEPKEPLHLDRNVTGFVFEEYVVHDDNFVLLGRETIEVVGSHKSQEEEPPANDLYNWKDHNLELRSLTPDLKLSPETYIAGCHSFILSPEVPFFIIDFDSQLSSDEIAFKLKKTKPLNYIFGGKICLDESGFVTLVRSESQLSIPFFSGKNFLTFVSSWGVNLKLLEADKDISLGLRILPTRKTKVRTYKKNRVGSFEITDLRRKYYETDPDSDFTVTGGGHRTQKKDVPEGTLFSRTGANELTIKTPGGNSKNINRKVTIIPIQEWANTMKTGQFSLPKHFHPLVDQTVKRLNKLRRRGVEFAEISLNIKKIVDAEKLVPGLRKFRNSDLAERGREKHPVLDSLIGERTKDVTGSSDIWGIRLE